VQGQLCFLFKNTFNKLWTLNDGLWDRFSSSGMSHHKNVYKHIRTGRTFNYILLLDQAAKEEGFSFLDCLTLETGKLGSFETSITNRKAITSQRTQILISATMTKSNLDQRRHDTLKSWSAPPWHTQILISAAMTNSNLDQSRFDKLKSWSAPPWQTQILISAAMTKSKLDQRRHDTPKSSIQIKHWDFLICECVSLDMQFIKLA
jgi:hypothetical protein